jgi:hypothetical protein
VSKLASAAAMVVPATVYCRGDARPFTPDEGDVCARAVITSYFSAKAEVNRRVNALLQYSRFRETYHGTEGNPSFWGSAMAKAAGKSTNDEAPDAFWTLAKPHAPDLAEVAKKLCNGFAGQGSSHQPVHRPWVCWPHQVASRSCGRPRQPPDSP